jgi:hypothetical protein
MSTVGFHLLKNQGQHSKKEDPTTYTELKGIVQPEKGSINWYQPHLLATLSNCASFYVNLRDQALRIAKKCFDL